MTKHTYKLMLVDENNTLVTIFELEGYDLSKPAARADLLDEIEDAILASDEGEE